MSEQIQPARQASICDRAREFLISQPGVTDAIVWESRSKMVAKVTVLESKEYSEIDLREACVKKLGAGLSPKMILIERIKEPGQRRSA